MFNQIIKFFLKIIEFGKWDILEVKQNLFREFEILIEKNF